MKRAIIVALVAALSGAILSGFASGAPSSPPQANGFSQPAKPVVQQTTASQQTTKPAVQPTTAPQCLSGTPAPSTGNVNLASAAYGKGCFVTVGSGGTILTSRDKVNWTVVNLGAQLHLNTMNLNLSGVAYGNGTFVVVGTDSVTNGGDYGAIFTSPDGATWTEQNPQIPLPLWIPASQSTEKDSKLGGVSFLNGKFIAVGGDFSQGLILTSADGVIWAATMKSLGGDGGGLSSIAYGNGPYVAMGGILVSNGVGGSAVLTSTDGSTWAMDPSWNKQTLVSGGVTYSAGYFEIAGVNGTVFTSTNGLTWTAK